MSDRHDRVTLIHIRKRPHLDHPSAFVSLFGRPDKKFCE